MEKKLDLPEYHCHKKVGAAKIHSIDFFADAEKGATLSLEMDRKGPGGSARVQRVNVNGDWLNRNPKVAPGGYFVQYIDSADGYTAYSPAEPFEKGYTLVSHITEDEGSDT
jgi:hypothetical protein